MYHQTFIKEQHLKNGLSKLAEVPALTSVQNFLMTLMNPAKEGRFFWSKDPAGITIRYLLLDPSEHFRQIAEEARAVILAGGTMSPMDQYVQELFPYIKDVRTLTCGHLIPRSNLLVRLVTHDNLGKSLKPGSHGFCGISHRFATLSSSLVNKSFTNGMCQTVRYMLILAGRMDFSHKSRSTKQPILQLHAILKPLVQSVIGGIVVFFPSYDFMEWATKVLRDGLSQDLERFKRLFFDDRSKAAEETFQSYSEAVRNEQGAVLFSVLGGKLSEVSDKYFLGSAHHAASMIDHKLIQTRSYDRESISRTISAAVLL